MFLLFLQVTQNQLSIMDNNLISINGIFKMNDSRRNLVDPELLKKYSRTETESHLEKDFFLK